MACGPVGGESSPTAGAPFERDAPGGMRPVQDGGGIELPGPVCGMDLPFRDLGTLYAMARTLRRSEGAPIVRYVCWDSSSAEGFCVFSSTGVGTVLIPSVGGYRPRTGLISGQSCSPTSEQAFQRHFASINRQTALSIYRSTLQNDRALRGDYRVAGGSGMWACSE